MSSRGSSTSPSASRVLTNTKCRNANYPRTQLSRFHVPDEVMKWEVPFPDYKPICYESESIKGKPWADADETPSAKIWNKLDETNRVDRKSHVGQYKVSGGYPQNPAGRTGITGRGMLGRWGPNHAADPIVTRWKRNNFGEKVPHPLTGKNILQFIAIQRKDSGEWAIPGGMVDPGELVSSALKREFGEEAMATLDVDEKDRGALEKNIDRFFRDGFEVYRGYVDDPRNTDNAWMETVAFNFHDDDGKCVGRFKLHAGDDAVGVKWVDINHSIKLYASHSDMIKRVAERHEAHW